MRLSSAPSVPRAAACVVGAVAVGAGLLVLTGLPQGAARDTAINSVSMVLATAAGFICWRAARRAAGNTRRGWTAMAIGCWTWAASQACWTVVDALELALPAPSLVELGYVAFPIAAGLGLRWLAGPSSGLSTSRRVLDRLMVGCAFSLVTWVAVLDTVVENSAGDLLPDALAIYYPVADVALVTITVLSVMQLRHDLLRWCLLGGGVLLMALTDHVVAYELALGSYRGGSGFLWGWWLSFALIGASALITDRVRTTDSAAVSTGRALWTALVPYVPLLAAVLLAGADLVIAVENDATSEILIVTLVLLMLARQYVTLRDNLALTRAVRQREDQLRHLAFHDGLTGLANRALFLDRLGHALDLARRNRQPVSVAFLDLDGFKAVNDSLGHAVGDALLVRVAERLRGSLRTADTLARLGGDEFAILIEQGNNPSAVAHGLIEALQAPFHLGERTLSISASVGVATAGSDHTGADHSRADHNRADHNGSDHSGAVHAANLLHRADIAMYAVKTSGKGHVQVHSPALELVHRRDDPPLQQVLAAALAGGGVQAIYQPVVDPRSGRIAALETLARWNHDGQDLSNDLLTRLCEQSGRSAQLTAAMLAQACDRLASWNQELGHRRLRIAININPTEFSDADLPHHIAELLDRHRLGPGQLVLEIADVAAGNRPDTAIEVMQRIRELGVRLSLDGFGTGSSNLTRLRHTPVDTVKIDQSFVADIDHDGRQRSFLAGLLDLARHLGLRTVAEGVERTAQLHTLRGMGCDLVQGRAIAPPADSSTTSALVLADRPLLPAELLDAAGGRASARS